MAPVVALGKPYDFARSGHVSPILLVLAGFKLRRNFFFQNVAYRAGIGVRDPQLRFFVIARSRYKSELRRVRTPLSVGEIGADTVDVIANTRAMLIGRQLQANNFWRIDVNDDSLDHGHR